MGTRHLLDVLDICRRDVEPDKTSVGLVTGLLDGL